jgi:hypothetical protein
MKLTASGPSRARVQSPETNPGALLDHGHDLLLKHELALLAAAHHGEAVA